MTTEYELGEQALQQSLAEEQARIEAYRPGRRRAPLEPKPLTPKPGGGVFRNGKATTLEQLRAEDAKGIEETIKLFSRGKVEPADDGLWVLGDKDDPSDLDRVIEEGMTCHICKKGFENAIVGEVVLYGDEIFHFDCLVTRMLYKCKGNEYEACKMFNIPLVDIQTVKFSYPSALWVKIMELSK